MRGAASPEGGTTGVSGPEVGKGTLKWNMGGWPDLRGGPGGACVMACVQVMGTSFLTIWPMMGPWYLALVARVAL